VAHTAYCTNAWLGEVAASLVRTHFSECDGLPIRCCFRASRSRILGRIRIEGASVVITLHGELAAPTVPYEVILYVLAHEMAHLIWLLNPLTAARYPHRGGVVEAELAHRGLTCFATFAAAWLHANWSRRLRNLMDATPSPASARWQRFLAGTKARRMSAIAARADELADEYGLDGIHVCWANACSADRGVCRYDQRRRLLELHPALASPLVPDMVIDLQLLYGLAYGRLTDEVDLVSLPLLSTAAETIKTACRWETEAWPSTRRRVQHDVHGRTLESAA